MKEDLEAKIAEAYTSQPLKAIDVPELGETWYSTPFTLSDLAKIDKLAKGDRFETLIYTMIEKCVDERGEPIFTVKDKPMIANKLPSDLISRIVNRINESDGFEIARKN